MRMMLRFTLPVEKGNQAFDAGVIGETMESLMGKLKPEAAYFGPSQSGAGDYRRRFSAQYLIATQTPVPQQSVSNRDNALLRPR